MHVVAGCAQDYSAIRTCAFGVEKLTGGTHGFGVH